MFMIFIVTILFVTCLVHYQTRKLPFKKKKLVGWLVLLLLCGFCIFFFVLYKHFMAFCVYLVMENNLVLFLNFDVYFYFSLWFCCKPQLFHGKGAGTWVLLGAFFFALHLPKGSYLNSAGLFGLARSLFSVTFKALKTICCVTY